MKKHITFILLIIVPFMAFSQRDSSSRKNSFFLNLSVFTPGVGYERIINKGSSVKWKASFNLSTNPVSSYYIITNPTIGFFTGKNKHHFELDAGVSLWFDGGGGCPTCPGIYKRLELILPSIHLGYRYQKPSNQFIFRVGAGFPEIILLGVGRNF